MTLLKKKETYVNTSQCKIDTTMTLKHRTMYAPIKTI